MKGRAFWKMTGSGNDFVFFDCREVPAGILESAEMLDALCQRRTGVGADGVVFVERDPSHAFSIRYFNRDGSLAELCGNASLCSVTLARTLGAVPPEGDFTFQTSSGPMTGRVVGGVPEIDIASVTDEAPALDLPRRPGEQRVGFARVGVPHVVVLVDDIESVDVVTRGRELRHWPAFQDGANANFVAHERDGTWSVRTYERGVEDETLACGTGAVATCALLSDWKLVPGQASLRTRSGSTLLTALPSAPGQRPTLRGEGRLVFTGHLVDLD